jgi:hypothetical protein
MRYTLYLMLASRHIAQCLQLSFVGFYKTLRRNDGSFCSPYASNPWQWALGRDGIVGHVVLAFLVDRRV